MIDARTLTHQRSLALAATIVIVGLGLVGTHASTVGGLIVVAGMLGLMWMVHSYGRLGAEAPPAPRTKKRRKRKKG
jgi:hypothetical protein